MLIQRLHRSGHSLVITIPRSMADSRGWQAGEPLVIADDGDGLVIESLASHTSRLKPRKSSLAFSRKPAAQAAP